MRPVRDTPDTPDVGAVFRAHGALVVRALRRAGVAERDLADASQDVFVVVHRKLPGFEQRALLTTWLYRIALQVASQYRRKAYNRHEQLGEAAPPLADANEVPHLEQQEQVESILRALEGLSADKREVLVLHDLHELTMHEVATRVGCPLKTAFSRLYAARRQMIAELRKRGLAPAVCPLSWLARLPLGRRLGHATPGPIATAALGAQQLGLAALALLCLLPPSSHAAPSSALSSAYGATFARRGAERAAVAERNAIVWSSMPPKATVASNMTAPTRKPRLARRSTAMRVSLPAVAPAVAISLIPAEAPTPDDLEVIRASAVDLHPQVDYPLAAEAPAAAAHIRLHGPRDPASAIEAELQEL